MIINHILGLAQVNWGLWSPNSNVIQKELEHASGYSVVLQAISILPLKRRMKGFCIGEVGRVEEKDKEKSVYWA